jgi:hypothetical protein
MSTKNIARSVIEGGRCGHWKADVQRRIRQERTKARSFVGRARIDVESADKHPVPLRQPEYPCFADKLRPIYRLLDSRAGQPWAQVRSELFARFDTRTTPGRHVLFDHLLRDVSECSDEDSPDRRFARYFVDEACILRKDHGTGFSMRSVHAPRLLPDNRAIAAWVGQRKIGRMGKRFAWFVPVSEAAVLVYEGWKYQYAAVDEAGNVIRDPQPPAKYGTQTIPQPPIVRRSSARFRQHGQLDAAEEAYFLSLPQKVREEILALAPANV